MSHTKNIYLFVPPKTSKNPIIDYLSERYPRLPTDKMNTFFNKRIAPYSSSGKAFCNGVDDSSLEYLGDVEDWVTLISMNNEDVFAVLLFDINMNDENGKPILYIELLCGNQALPPTGEGTKLLRILEDASLNTNQFNIELSSVPRSVQYYTNNNYKIKNISTGRSLVDMQKNTRALSNWNKAKQILSENAINYLADKRAKIKKNMKTARGKKIRHSQTKRKKTTNKVK